MNNKEKTKILKFTDLIAWQEGHKLVLAIYKLIKGFLKGEEYCLIDQIRRAAVSITSCVAKGFTKQSNKEKTQFYKVSQGFLVELQNQLVIAKDIGYIDEQEFTEIADQTLTVHRLIIGLIKSSRLKNLKSMKLDYTLSYLPILNIKYLIPNT